MKTRIAQLLLVLIKQLMKSELKIKHMDGGHLEARLYFVPHTRHLEDSPYFVQPPGAPANNNNNKEQLN